MLTMLTFELDVEFGFVLTFSYFSVFVCIFTQHMYHFILRKWFLFFKNSSLIKKKTKTCFLFPLEENR